MPTNLNKTLITVVGPTAIGKTALAINLANHFNTEIISCDSRQFYKEMTIGTAVPEPEELAAATHHFIQNRSIFDDYNVGQFEKDSLLKIKTLFLKHDVLIMVGGSGLYVDAVLKGLDYLPEVDTEIRKQLTLQLASKGITYLQNKLKELDIESYNTIAIDNPHRIIRALEICIGTGNTYSSYKNKPKSPRNFASIKIGVSTEREIIYNRINQRVDVMIQNGLLQEAKKLHPQKQLNALQTVGYRELFQYFEGNFTKEFAFSEIKKNTRRFAKRQLTWFRKDKTIIWVDYKEEISKILLKISEQLVKN